MKNSEINEVLNAFERNGSLSVVGGRYAKSKVNYIAGLTADITTSGKLIDSSTKDVTGTSSFDGNRLPKGHHFLVTGVRVLFDTTASVTLASAVWGDEAPAKWKNGELTISQKGAGELMNLPVSAISNSYAATSNNDDVFAVQPFIIRPEVEFDILADILGGADNDMAYRVELYGVEFVEKSQA